MVLVAAGALNVFLGAYFYEDMYASKTGANTAIAGYVVLGVGVFAFIGGEFFIGQKHHNGGASNTERAAMLPN